MDLQKKEQIEIDWWKNSKFESPEKFTKENFINKVTETKHFNYKINKYRKLFTDKASVLELGAGQGWASCFLKSYYLPNAFFTVTDISPHAIASLRYWEDIYDVKIEERFAAKSYQLKLPDASFDLIFCYAAAHHFVQHDKTLKELARLLRPKGKIIYLYEPLSSKLLYRIYYWYVNKARHSTPEDVLVTKNLNVMAIKHGLKMSVNYDPHQSIVRSMATALYFKLLSWFKFTQSVFPASGDLIFEKTSLNNQ